MRTCSRCHTVNPDDNTFCEGCGMNLLTGEVPQTEPTVETPSNVPPVVSPTPNTQYHYKPYKQRKGIFNDQQIGRIIKNLAIAFAVIAFVACLFAMFSCIQRYNAEMDWVRDLREIEGTAAYELRREVQKIADGYQNMAIICGVGALIFPFSFTTLYGFGTLITTIQSIDRKLK